MNAHKFVAEHGIDEAKRVLSGAPEGADLFHTNTYIKNAHSEGYTDYFARWSDGFKDWVNAIADREFIDESIDLSELKQVVESLELISWHGSLGSAKTTFKRKPVKSNLGMDGWNMLEKAITDYELVESYKQVKCEVLDMVDVSPRCEVRNG
ncbi:hypothetical protein [Acinetobacter sp. FDAARGOS_515]|uniref:hypothetical protein n=1 Tax=Acinetobacter sp. FDAARGOS_515 TaxID=2420307 RepID=UPI000F66E3B9|nr:hypothetical protein [Acinetobacter sp. FDAARGOS_515]RSC23532.1 hypothetical protein EGS47_12645 [Acinetobacter sp. FDAARGOS_515]